MTADIDPLSGGLAGLAKTAGHEWPEIHCKALDLAAAWADPDEAALAVIEEMQCAGPIEVGLTSSGRSGLTLSEAPLHHAAEVSPLSPGDVVVVTGGARGVTAEGVLAVAREFASTIVALGRSPEPVAEPSWLSSLNDEAAIKRAIKEHIPGASTPRDIGEHFARLSANREILRNLERIRSTGVQVHYHQVDIRNERAVGAAIEAIRAQIGPIKGLIHGAGILADRLIEDKTEEQFASVYATKVVGLRNLLAALSADSLRALVLFSSSTGRFGRSGQVDYAVANEVLNKMAQCVARQHPACRVVSVNWGPWDGGMVTPSLKKVFENEGIGLIPLEAGADYLVQEMRQANGPVEVVVLGPGSRVPAAPEPSPADPNGTKATKLVQVFERELSLERYPVLQSHIIDGRAVVPMALILEWLGHAALHGNPGLLFHGFNDLRICKGVQISEDHPRSIRVLTGKACKRDSLYQVPVELHGSANGRDVLHASAEIVLAARKPSGQPLIRDLPQSPYGRDRAEDYNERLFHGPMLQGIEQIESCSTHGISATVSAAPAPASWMQTPLRPAWVADPLVLDCSFQLMILWSFELLGTAGLPCFAARYRQFRRSFPRDGVRVVVSVTHQNAHQALADIDYVDQAGEVIATMSGYECVIDASLNQAFRRNRLTREAQPAT
jgi:NAD(P)-dependent dehydrogenase (short-subunit alcohol dehydrogenase family)